MLVLLDGGDQAGGAVEVADGGERSDHRDALVIQFQAVDLDPVKECPGPGDVTGGRVGDGDGGQGFGVGTGLLFGIAQQVSGTLRGVGGDGREGLRLPVRPERGAGDRLRARRIAARRRRLCGLGDGQLPGLPVPGEATTA
ncbi:hypothetical protein AB0M46_04940 [Dactylosporangium sp. NPDC051485]|uniref:hypothetical protein n=1 Tax=Dactylosporangium sp. NPDC051485 TaxID=3154846 RepID=UPI0034475B2E